MRTLASLALALAVAAVFVLSYLLEDVTELDLLTHAEAKLTDLRFDLRGPREPSGDVVVVAIDSQSVEALGRWPWSRKVHADLIDRLREWGAATVVFDVLFVEPQGEQESERLRRIERALPATATAAREEVAAALQEVRIDQQFAAALERTFDADAALTVLAFDFILPDETRRTRHLGRVLSPAGEQTILDLASYLSRDRNVPYLRRESANLALGIRPVITELADGAAALGFVDAVHDVDGVTRRERLVVAYCPGVKEAWEEGRDLREVLLDPRQRVQAAIPLTVAGVQTHLRLFADQLLLDLESGELRFPAGDGGERVVRFDAEDGTMLIDFYGASGQIPTYSYVDVLRGELPDGRDGPATLGGKLVFVGMTDPGNERDTFVTPFTASLSGVEKHATVADNILHGHQLRRHRDPHLAVILSALAAALAAALIFGNLSGAWGLLAAAAVALGWLAVTYRDFVSAGLLWNWTVPLLTLLFGGGVVMAYRQFRAQRARSLLEERSEFLRRTFSRYVSDEVVGMLLASPEKLRLGGEKRTLTILMTDLRGFTALCEQRTPEEVVHMLNLYLGTLADLVLKYDGIVDEFIGDAVLAIFGSPLSRADDAQRAVACAIEMQTALLEVNERFRQEGLPEIEMGIALNTGEVIVGNIGSARRRKYTAIGGSVNVVARIESYTVGGQILISYTTLEQVRDVVEVGDRIDVAGKGLKKPVAAYPVLGIGPPYNLKAHEPEEELVELGKPVEVRFVTLSGKKMGGDEVAGRLVRLSKLGADMACDEPPEPLVNLMLTVLAESGQPLAGDLYAKVVRRDTAAGLCPLRFTSTPRAVKRYFQSLRTGVLEDESRDSPMHHPAGPSS